MGVNILEMLGEAGAGVVDFLFTGYGTPEVLQRAKPEKTVLRGDVLLGVPEDVTPEWLENNITSRLFALATLETASRLGDPDDALKIAMLERRQQNLAQSIRGLMAATGGPRAEVQALELVRAAIKQGDNKAQNFVQASVAQAVAGAGGLEQVARLVNSGIEPDRLALNGVINFVKSLASYKPEEE